MSDVSAFEALKNRLTEAYEYAWAWHCNLAMACVDRLGVSKQEGNLVAELIMERFFELETTNPPGEPPMSVSGKSWLNLPPPAPAPYKTFVEQLDDAL